MFASIAQTPALATAGSTAAASKPRRNNGTVASASSSSGSGADAARDVVKMPAASAASRRGVLSGLAGALVAGVTLTSSPSPAEAKKANRLSDLSQITLSESAQAYQQSTLNLIAQTSALVQGQNKDVTGWLASSDEWYTGAKSAYSPKSQGRSFLMTTKLVAYLKNSFATLNDAEFDPSDPPFDVAKTAEWIQYAEGFTSGTLAGDEARSAFAKATWGNYDKSAPLNRFGLCAFGETGGTKALGVNCDGY